MTPQTEWQQNRIYKMKLLEFKRTIRILLCIILGLVFLSGALIFLLVKPFFQENGNTSDEDTNRFTGEHRVEAYNLQTEYKDKDGSGNNAFTTDILRFSGEGYANVATSIEEHFSLDNLVDRLHSNFNVGVNRIENITLECTRMDNKVISIKQQVFFSENNDGFVLQQGITFAVENGKVLELDNLLKDKKGFYKIIHELVVGQMPVYWPELLEVCPGYKKIYYEAYSDTVLPEWYLTEKGLAFSFEQYAFLSGAYGCMEVVVPYELVTAYFKPEYLPE